MKKETLIKARKILKDSGLDVIHLQGDNSNFFADGDGIQGNSIIFDDANEICYAIRLNNDSASPRGPYRLSIFDYDQLQYAVIEMQLDDVSNVIDKIFAIANSDVDKEKVKDKFKRRPHDKRTKRVNKNIEKL